MKTDLLFHQAAAPYVAIKKACQPIPFSGIPRAPGVSLQFLRPEIKDRIVVLYQYVQLLAWPTISETLDDGPPGVFGSK